MDLFKTIRLSYSHLRVLATVLHYLFQIAGIKREFGIGQVNCNTDNVMDLQPSQLRDVF